MKQHLNLLLAFVLGTIGQVTANASEVYSFNNLNRVILDGNWSGLSDTRSVTSSIGSLGTVRVKLKVVGEYNGDLYCYLRHVSTTATNICVLLNRVGRSATSAHGYDDTGLDVQFDDLAANGNIHIYQSVTNPPTGTPLRGAWRPDGRRVDPSTVLDTTPVTTPLSVFNGAPASGTWTLFVADVDSGGTNMLAGWELEVSGAVAPAITWATPANITYGTALSASQLNASAGTVAGTFAYQPASGTVLTAGTHTLQAVFTPSDPVSYLTTTSSVSIPVLQKSLTVTANNASKTYDSFAYSGGNGVNYGGWVNGEGPGVLTGSLTYGGSSQGAVNAGTYTIVPGGVANPNYAINFVNGSLTIGKAGSSGIVSVSKNPAKPGESVTMSVTLSAVAPGGGVPAGSVQLRIDGAAAGAPAPLSGGVASYATSSLTVGTHTVVAEYPGNVNFLGTTNTLSSTLLINTPPVAGTDTIVRSGTNDAKVAIAALLANDSDADGDPVTFVAATATSTNSGTVSRQGDWLNYTPPASSSGGDAFTYTISDGRGTPVTGTVVVTVGPDTVASPNLIVIDQGNGSYLIQFNGIPNVSYRIEYCENLSTPNWQSLTTKTADSNGLFQYIDTPPTGSPTRYYRSVYP